jgi:Ala-tRNA(Pro) deacylase
LQAEWPVTHQPPSKEKAMPVKKMKRLLDENDIDYVTFQHWPAYSAQETAQSAHIPGKNLAKTVMLRIDDKMAMAVVPASHHVDLESIKRTAGASEVELAGEEEFVDMFPDCEAGAMPPFGNLYGMDVFVSDALAEDEAIAFCAGTHTDYDAQMN